MIKKAITTVTILLVILGVGIVFTKASPRVGRYEVDNQRVDVAGNDTHGLAVTERRVDLVEEMNQRVKVGLQNVRVLDERVQRDVSRKMPNRLVGNEADTLRGVVVDNQPVLLDAHYQGNHFYLNNWRNLVGGMKHLNKDSHLAVYNLRACVPRQLENVLSGPRPDDFQKVPVFGTVEVLKELTVDNVLAALALTSFEVPSVKALRHEEFANANPLVQQDTENVTGKLGELDLAVA